MSTETLLNEKLEAMQKYIDFVRGLINDGQVEDVVSFEDYTSEILEVSDDQEEKESPVEWQEKDERGGYDDLDEVDN